MIFLVTASRKTILIILSNSVPVAFCVAKNPKYFHRSSHISLITTSESISRIQLSETGKCKKYISIVFTSEGLGGHFSVGCFDQECNFHISPCWNVFHMGQIYEQMYLCKLSLKKQEPTKKPGPIIPTSTALCNLRNKGPFKQMKVSLQSELLPSESISQHINLMENVREEWCL